MTSTPVITAGSASAFGLGTRALFAEPAGAGRARRAAILSFGPDNEPGVVAFRGVQ